MRENRTCGSEGGEAKAFPTPIIPGLAPHFFELDGYSGQARAK